MIETQLFIYIGGIITGLFIISYVIMAIIAFIKNVDISDYNPFYDQEDDGYDNEPEFEDYIHNLSE